MGRLNLKHGDVLGCDRVREQEIVERGEQRVEEARMAHSPSPSPFDMEMIDIDNITALMACGKRYSVEELIEQFGISVDTAESLLAPRNCTEIFHAIVEPEIAETIDSVLCEAVLSESAEPFDDALPQNGTEESIDDELAWMVCKLEELFD